MGITSKNALTILYTTLRRTPKFERVAGKAWGLAEWYPEKRKRKEQEEETLG
jgi:DNA-directed RNA polymerase delta subunit